MKDPMGALITELRDANIAAKRVRAEMPAPTAAGYEGDALGPGRYKRFVVLSHLAMVREHRAPFAEHRISCRAYGSTYQDAAALWGDISDALDNAGPRITGTTGIYQSLDETGGSAGMDPDTLQPFYAGTIALYAATEAVA